MQPYWNFEINASTVSLTYEIQAYNVSHQNSIHLIVNQWKSSLCGYNLIGYEKWYYKGSSILNG